MTYYLINNLPNELDELSSHTGVDEVADVDIDEIELNSDGAINVTGSAVVTVSIQLGSDSDNKGDENMHSTFPFTFKLALEWNKKWLIEESEDIDIQIDTTEY